MAEVLESEGQEGHKRGDGRDVGTSSSALRQSLITSSYMFIFNRTRDRFVKKAAFVASLMMLRRGAYVNSPFDKHSDSYHPELIPSAKPTDGAGSRLRIVFLCASIVSNLEAPITIPTSVSVPDCIYSSRLLPPSLFLSFSSLLPSPLSRASTYSSKYPPSPSFALPPCLERENLRITLLPQFLCFCRHLILWRSY